VESLNKEYYVTQVKVDRVESDIEVLLTLWQQRWGPKPMAHWHRRILRYFFDRDCLWLSVMWDGATPMAALAAVVDRGRKVFYGYIIAYNARYAKLSPGKVLRAYGIRNAIENGFQVYDFLGGADNHKFSFGARQRGTKNVIIARKGLRSTVANSALALISQLGGWLKKPLGKIKRIGIVKRMWFWLRIVVKR
jgi:hypothetical protein